VGSAGWDVAGQQPGDARVEVHGFLMRGGVLQDRAADPADQGGGQQGSGRGGADGQAGDPGDPADSCQRVRGQRPGGQQPAQPRQAHGQQPRGEAAVGHLRRAGQRGHRGGQPPRRPALPYRVAIRGASGAATAPPADHRCAAEVGQMVPGDDGSGDRDGDRERRAAAADQRPAQQRHGPARQQHPGQGHDLGDDQPAQHGHRGSCRQNVQRVRRHRAPQ